MRFIATYILLILIVLLFTFLLLVGLTEAFLYFPLADMHQIQLNFQEFQTARGKSFSDISGKLSFYLYAFQHVWVLWMVPLMGGLVFWISGSYVRQSGEKKLLEHVYFLETSLERVTQFEQKSRAELENYREHLFHVYEKATEGFIFIGEEETVQHLNMAAVQMLTRWHNQQEQFINRLAKDIIPAYEQSGLYAHVKNALFKGEAWSGEIELLSAKAWVDVKIFLVENSVALVVKETTHVHVEQGEVQLSTNLLSQLMTGSPNALAVLDRNFKFTQVSQGWAQLFNIDAESVLGQVYEQVLPNFPDDWPELKEQILAGKFIQRDEVNATLNGEDVWLQLKIQPWRTDENMVGGYMLFVRNITSTKLANQRLRQLEEQENKLAYNDLLTGLPNRQLFYDRLSMSLAMAYRQLNKVGLMFLDLDGFKSINDTLGHEAGDMLLQAVAERLKKCVREVDTVARLGGDEFTVIANVQGPDDCARIAEKIIASINEPFELGDHKDVRIGTSIGISLYPQDGDAANELIRKSDVAMYVSKKGGKNQYHFYDPAMEETKEDTGNDDA
ncbi:MAG: GGDEF domain-containing protein [Alphaproteobacteria bacterium]|nr:GGDEF domain-containing protein [Alphaproteobacteria bacterium]MDD9919657.1 GGDEF domain-containing protein [Alphaproteobacteria bacterium]